MLPIFCFQIALTKCARRGSCLVFLFVLTCLAAFFFSICLAALGFCRDAPDSDGASGAVRSFLGTSPRSNSSSTLSPETLIAASLARLNLNAGDWPWLDELVRQAAVNMMMVIGVGG